jgi:lipoprotein-releasing system permease protein
MHFELFIALRHIKAGKRQTKTWTISHVVVSPNEDYINIYKNIVLKINSIDGVVASSPYLIGEASFKLKDIIKDNHEELGFS